ncbi:hypothetical protein DES53_103338 [Roseimicrobium gellanilyticum]|uniref:Uncharacterized protein n=1 Tax=Roseimicrobium gellanilyticum TaxID=748857 RepID=A0A366HPA1_9BACT|nr:Amuc_1100 family pilus-like protein [Roseimicrobium gellanilyticum]RBP45340.1 hypothetical protein DES53_103338 [Roseimicrobium gellanilyticum]
MNWVQENKSLAGILGVMIAGILGLGAWLYLSYADYAASMETWGQNDSSISALKSKKVYPNKENAEARETEVGSYGDKVDLLRTALLSEKVQQSVKPMSQTEFQAKLKERATAVVQMAKSADITLPADFALGFADYTNNVPRTPEVAAELGVQLDVMERLVTTVIQSGVKSIELFDRTKLPTEDRPVEPKPVKVAPEKKSAKNSKTKKGAKRVAITEEQAAEPVLDRYPVKMIFTTDQAPFQNIVNTLCDPIKMPHFLVVRLVRIENERQDGPSRDEIARKKNPDVSLEAPADSAPAGAAAAPKVAPDAVTVMGEEKLKVYVEVDYVRFRKPAVAEEATETPAPASNTASTANP